MNQGENQKGSVQTSANNPQLQMLQQMQTQIPQSSPVDEIPMKEPKQKNHDSLILVIVFLVVIAILCFLLFQLSQENEKLKREQESTTSENQPSSTPSTTIVSPSTSVTPSGYTGKVVCTKQETVDTKLGYVSHTGTFENGVISYLEIYVYLQYEDDISLQDRQAIVEDSNIIGDILRQQYGFSNFTVDATLDGYSMTIQGTLDQIDDRILASNTIYPNMTNDAFLNSRTQFGFTCDSEI